MDGVLMMRVAILVFVAFLFITLCAGGLIDRNAPELKPANNAEAS